MAVSTGIVGHLFRYAFGGGKPMSFRLDGTMAKILLLEYPAF
jgi:hypothetical protein